MIESEGFPTRCVLNSPCIVAAFGVWDVESVFVGIGIAITS